jgi:hypothetical protein
VNIGKICRLSAKALTDHLDAVVKDQLKLVEDEKKKVEKEALKQQKDDIKKKSEDLKKQSKQTMPLPLMFAAAEASPNKVAIAEKTESELTDHDWDQPLIITEGKSLTKWDHEKTTQVVMAKWAGKYKKLDGFEEHRTQSSPMEAGQGLKETETLFEGILTSVSKVVLDLSELSKTWNTTSWLYGHDLDYNQAGVSPNSSAILRYQCMGTVKYYMFDLAKCKSPPDFTMTQLKMLIGKITIDTDVAQSIFKAGAPIKYGEVRKGQLLFVPAGHFILEHVVHGPLCFGLRKSVFIRSALQKDSYDAARTLMKNDGQDVSKMDIIMKKFQ